MIKINNISDKLKMKKALIAGIELRSNYNNKTKISLEDSLNELKELAKAANYEVISIIKQTKDKINPATYLGKGKLQEINYIINTKEIDLVIFDDELSGIQIRNLESIIGTDIIDRTGLILNIFADRAKSKEGKLQIELAKLKYQLPRLIGWGKTLSRTGAGIGTRGLGESKLELDRRRISKKISLVENSLKEVKKHRELQRRKRKKNEIHTVALLGYTNSGKSTLMNYFITLDKKHGNRNKAYVQNMLFATLDPFHKIIKLENNTEFILIDTVGFVSKLPHFLVEAFKSTLEEITEADLLIYVVDISQENYTHQLKVTKEIVKELNSNDKPHITVFNKIDKLTEEQLKTICDISENSVDISALNGVGIEKLIDKIKYKLFNNEKRVSLLIPFELGNLTSYLIQNTRVISQNYTEKGVVIESYLNEKNYNKYKEFMI